ncbi:hypothetical protein [Tenacibaculum sp.]
MKKFIIINILLISFLSFGQHIPSVLKEKGNTLEEIIPNDWREY